MTCTLCILFTLPCYMYQQSQCQTSIPLTIHIIQPTRKIGERLSIQHMHEMSRVHKYQGNPSEGRYMAVIICSEKEDLKWKQKN